MNKNKMLLLLAIGMIMGGCGRKDDNKIKNNVEQNPVTDTLLVVGVLHQPSASYNHARKYLKCVNKQGAVYNVEVDIMPNAHTVGGHDRDPIISYIERGDTIVVENGVIVKNITMDNMINRYVNGR